MTGNPIRGWKGFSADNYAIILLEICLFIHLTSCLVGWGQTLDDFHGFRQTQTAITSYYAVQDGFKLDYETPVLGKPWSIPFEFPLYQWLVAGAHLLLGTPLDQTGRFFSLFFFYLCLFPLYSLLGFLTLDRAPRMIALCFVLMNPIYLFWSRTFLMESTALFFGLLFTWAAAKALEKNSGKAYLTLAILAGTLSGLVKVTTFTVFLFPTLLILAVWAYRSQPPYFSKQEYPRILTFSCLLFGIPLAVSWAWVRYTDMVKARNPLADHFLTSQSLHTWSFGTLPQRATPEAWNTVFAHTHILDLLGYLPIGGLRFPLLLALLILAPCSLPGNKKKRLLCILFFLVPVSVFFNLNFVHDYYLYSTCFFLSISAALVLWMPWGTFGRDRLKFLPFLLVPLFLSLSYRNYLQEYRTFKGFKSKNEFLCQWIRQNTAPQDILLIYGFDYDSTIPYYSQRKAIMDRWEMPLEDPRMEQSLDSLGNLKIGAMLVNGPRSLDFLRKRVARFKLDPRPFFLDGCFVFLKRTDDYVSPVVSEKNKYSRNSRPITARKSIQIDSVVPPQ